MYYCSLYRLTGDHSNLADFKLINFMITLQVIYKKTAIFEESKVMAFYINRFPLNCQLACVV